MPAPLESKAEQIQVIEANAEKFAAVAIRGYTEFQEKGVLIILRQLENNSTQLEDWQIVYKPISLLANMISDWKESGLQDLIIKYNPDVSAICTFLYPNGTHSSYHFSIVED